MPLHSHFQVCAENENTVNVCLFHRNQLRRCITTADRKVKFVTVSSIQELWRSGWELRGGTSRFYDVFRKHQPPNYEGVKLAWEKDLGPPIDCEVWKESIRSWYTIARDMHSFRILNRNYWNPAKMSRLGLRENGVGDVRTKGAHWYKCFYECEMVHSLWVAVIQCINKVLKVEFREGPALCILGILQRKSGLSTQIRTWVKLALVTENRVVLRHWKSEEKEGIFKEWRDELR